MPLIMHFLNVGHGDCTIIEFEGRLTVIDINGGMSLPADVVKEIAKSLGHSETDLLLAERKGIKLYGIDRYEKLLVDPVEFIKSRYSAQGIFRFILTHPHIDHMNGLNKLVNENIEITNFWDTNHDIKHEEDDFKENEAKYLDWLRYEILRLGGKDQNVTVLKLL